jgi:hypothetical protein
VEVLIAFLSFFFFFRKVKKEKTMTKTAFDPSEVTVIFVLGNDML